MVGKAADVLVRIKGDHKNLDGAVNSSKGKLGGLKAAAVAVGPAMALGVGIAAGAFLKMSITAAAEEEKLNITTQTLLEKQGVAWDGVKDHISGYLDELEALTAFGDTELQATTNVFLSAGLDMETSLKATSAAASLAASTNMSLASASEILRRQYQSGTSRLKNYGIEAENFDGILQQINAQMGDGSQHAEGFEGAMAKLKTVTDDMIADMGAELLPILTEVVVVFADGARTVLPYVVKGLKMLLVPLKFVVHEFKMTHMILKAVWRSLKGDFAGAKEIIKDMSDEQLEFNRGLLDTAKDVLGIELAQESLNQEYATQALLLGDVANAQDVLTQATKESAKAESELEAAYRKAREAREAEWKRAGGWVSGAGELVSAKEMGVSGTRSTAWDEPSHAQRPEHLWGTPAKAPTVKSLAATPPSISQTVNIGTVNESSAGNVADAINKALRKAVTLNPW